MWKQFETYNETSSKSPVMLIALSTFNPQFEILYSQARELAAFLLESIQFKKFAALYCSALPAAINISSNGTSDLVGVNFYEAKPGSKDVVLLSGYGSPASSEYEFGAEILAFAQRISVKEIISVGARWNEEPLPPLEKPKVLGFSTDEEGTAWLQNNGVSLLQSEPAYYFANTIVAMAPQFGMRGFKLSVNHGEPRPHPRSVISIVEVLEKKLDLSLDTSKLETKAEELSKFVLSSGYQDSDNPEVSASKGKEDIYR